MLVKAKHLKPGDQAANTKTIVSSIVFGEEDTVQGLEKRAIVRWSNDKWFVYSMDDELVIETHGQSPNPVRDGLKIPALRLMIGDIVGDSKVVELRPEPSRIVVKYSNGELVSYDKMAPVIVTNCSLQSPEKITPAPEKKEQISLKDNCKQEWFTYRATTFNQATIELDRRLSQDWRLAGPLMPVCRNDEILYSFTVVREVPNPV